MEKKNFWFLAGILIIIGLVTGYLIIDNTQNNKKIDFETISKGHYSNYKEPGNYFINNDEELESQGVNIPEINFSQVSIIAVFMGEFNTGGYSIEITEIIEKENEIIVKVNKIYPEPGSLLTQALSQPYHIIKTKKINKKVVFEDES